jgi:hypothetical protein
VPTLTRSQDGCSRACLHTTGAQRIPLEGIAPGDVPLVGCSPRARAAPGDKGVVVTALGGEGFAVSTAVATGMSARLREAGARSRPAWPTSPSADALAGLAGPAVPA